LQCPVENTKDINGAVSNEVSNPVMAIQENTNLTFRLFTVLIADFRKIPQELSFFINA